MVLGDSCKIWEACRATTAATGFFDPIVIGKYNQRFADGALLYNNPILLVEREAKKLWRGRKTLMISIGTGGAPDIPLDGSLIHIAKSLVKLVTEAQRTNNDFFHSHETMVAARLFFRFDVESMLASVELDEYKHLARIKEITDKYLKDGKIAGNLADCVERLRGGHPEGTVALSKKSP